MAKLVGKLTALQVTRAGVGKHHDGAGLYLIVREDGSRSWAYRYGPGGKSWYGIGPSHVVTLAEAREKRRLCKQMLLEGTDPINARRAQKAAAAKAMTFAQAADACLKVQRENWRSPRAESAWEQKIAVYANPIIGDLPIAEIDTGLVVKILEPIWLAKAPTAVILRSHLETILDWAKVSGHRVGENPARWRGHLKHLLPSQKKIEVRHMAALPYADMSQFVADLQRREGTLARLLEFVIFNAARIGEVVGATWDEIEEGVWTIPADRMKAHRKHRVPLSTPALKVLEQMRTVRTNTKFPQWGKLADRLSKSPVQASNRIFFSPCGFRSDATEVLRLAKEIAGCDITVHGFRSTFRDWAGDCTNFPREVPEAALAHKAEGGETEEAYLRSAFFEKRRRLMEAWGRFCTTPFISSEVTPIGQRG